MVGRHDAGSARRTSPMIIIDQIPYRVRLMIFDKDGTLFDFHHMWGTWSARLLQLAVAGRDDEERLYQVLCESLGYDTHTDRVLHDSPLSVAPTADLPLTIATVLYGQGFGWAEAKKLADLALERRGTEIDLAASVRTIGDVAGFFRRLRQAGIRIAVVTTDERLITEPMLELGGIADMVDFIACSDDGLSIKPAPDAVLAACKHTGIAPLETIVVGDNTADMQMGRHAGVRLCVGVLSGVAGVGDLDSYADVVLDSIHDIVVLDDEVLS